MQWIQIARRTAQLCFNKAGHKAKEEKLQGKVPWSFFFSGGPVFWGTASLFLFQQGFQLLLGEEGTGTAAATVIHALVASLAAIDTQPVSGQGAKPGND